MLIDGKNQCYYTLEHDVGTIHYSRTPLAEGNTGLLERCNCERVAGTLKNHSPSESAAVDKGSQTAQTSFR